MCYWRIEKLGETAHTVVLDLLLPIYNALCSVNSIKYAFFFFFIKNMYFNFKKYFRGSGSFDILAL